MKKKWMGFFIWLSIFSVLILLNPFSSMAGYPEKPVNFICGFPAGEQWT